MVSPTDNDMPDNDDVTLRPLDDLFERTKMPPPLKIVLASPVLKSI